MGIAVRRPVIIEDEEAAQLQRDIKRRIKREMPSRKSRHISVLPPEDWSLTIIEKGKLSEQLQIADVVPDRRQMWRLAGVLRQALRVALKDDAEALALPLGVADRFGPSDLKPAVGLTPAGWKGRRARYALHDDEGNRMPLGSLVEENQVCVGAITEALCIDPTAASETLSKAPHISVLRNRKGIRDHEFRVLGPLVEEVVPATVTLGDPVIYLHDKGYADPFEITIRPSSAAGELEPAPRKAA